MVVEVDYEDFMWFLKIANLVGPEVKINIENGEMWFRKKDKYNFQLINAKIPCKSSEDAVMVIDAEWAIDKLKLIKTDTVSIAVGDSIVIDAGNIKLSYKLIDPSIVQQSKELNLNLPVKYPVDMSLLYRVMTIISNIGAYAEFYVVGNEVKVVGKGDEEKVEVKLSEGVGGDGDEEYRTKVNPSLLLPVLKLVKDMYGEISQGTDKPLKLSVSNGGMHADIFTAPLLD